MKGINLKPVTNKLKPLINFVKKDSVAIFLIIVAIIFGFLIWRIGNLAGATPDQDEIDEKLTGIVRPRLDPDSIKQIEELESQDIDINSSISNRSNPFQE
jgi:hypothetical protein